MIKNSFIPYYKRFINVILKYDIIYLRLFGVFISMIGTTVYFFNNLPIAYVIAFFIIHICIIFLVVNSCCKSYITYVGQENGIIFVEYYKYNAKKTMQIEERRARVCFAVGRGIVYEFRIYCLGGKQDVAQECIEEWAKKEKILELQKIFNSTEKLYK